MRKFNSLAYGWKKFSMKKKIEMGWTISHQVTCLFFQLPNGVWLIGKWLKTLLNIWEVGREMSDSLSWILFFHGIQSFGIWVRKLFHGEKERHGENGLLSVCIFEFYYSVFL